MTDGMGVSSFNDLKEHIGHRIECACYVDRREVDEDGNPLIVNVALECVDCFEVLLDFDRYENYSFHQDFETCECCGLPVKDLDMGVSE